LQLRACNNNMFYFNAKCLAFLNAGGRALDFRAAHVVSDRAPPFHCSFDIVLNALVTYPPFVNGHVCVLGKAIEYLGHPKFGIHPSLVSKVGQLVSGTFSPLQMELLMFFSVNCVCLTGLPYVYHLFLFSIFLELLDCYHVTREYPFRFAEDLSYDFVERSMEDSTMPSCNAFDIYGRLFKPVSVLIDFIDKVVIDYSYNIVDDIIHAFCDGEGCPSFTDRLLPDADMLLPVFFKTLYPAYVIERNTFWANLFGHPDSFSLLFQRKQYYHSRRDDGSHQVINWADLKSMYFCLWIIKSKFSDRFVTFNELRDLYRSDDIILEHSLVVAADIARSFHSVDVAVGLLGLLYFKGFLYFVDGCEPTGIQLGEWFISESESHSGYEDAALACGCYMQMYECDSSCQVCKCDYEAYSVARATSACPSVELAADIITVIDYGLNVAKYDFLLDYPHRSFPTITEIPSVEYLISKPLNLFYFPYPHHGPDFVHCYIMYHQWNLQRRVLPDESFGVISDRYLSPRGRGYWQLLSGRRKFPVFQFPFPFEIIFHIFRFAFPHKFFFEGSLSCVDGPVSWCENIT